MRRWNRYSDRDIKFVKDNAQYGSDYVARELSQLSGIKRTARGIVTLCHRHGIRLGRVHHPVGHEFQHRGLTYVKTKDGYVSKNRMQFSPKDGEVIIEDPWGDKVAVPRSFAGRLVYYGYRYNDPTEIKASCWATAKLKTKVKELYGE